MKRVFPILFLLLLSMYAIRPLFASGYFPMHDDTQVSRVIEMGKSLKEGQFPVRWVSDLGYGYGYPIYNFYGPLPYYAGGALYAVGVPAIIATKIMFAIGIVTPAIILFFVMSFLLGWQVGMLTSVLYLFFPYHAVQIYVRGAVGEYWTLMFWPLILYSFVSSKTNKRITPSVAGVIGISGAIVAHTLLGYVTVLVVAAMYVGYWTYRMAQKTFDLYTALLQGSTILLGLGVSAFFWLPAIVEMNFTSVSGQVSQTANYLDHFVCIGQLWSSLWGFAGSASGCIDGLSFMLGKIHLLLAAISVFLWVYMRPKAGQGQAIWTIGLVLAATGVFFTTVYSQALWSIIPGFSYIQYPWRFLGLASFGLALVGGVLPLILTKKELPRIFMVIILSIGVVYMSQKWFVPQYIYQKTSADFEDIVDLRWRVSKISDEYLPASVIRPKEASAAVFDTIDKGGALDVIELDKTAIYERLRVTATESAMVTLRKAYFPGWRYFVNQKEVTPIVTDGLPNIMIHQGVSEVSMIFTNTPVRILGNWISFISIWLVLGGMYYGKQRTTKR